MNEKFILDACCGGKMFYYEPLAPVVLFQDIRRETCVLSDRPKPFRVDPDVIGDFTSMDYRDGEFHIVVFDPPHLWRVGENSDFFKKYGKCPKDFKPWLSSGFAECFRVLRDKGILVWKWSEGQISFEEAVACSPYRPLLGNKRGKTRWTFFVKMEGMENE